MSNKDVKASRVMFRSDFLQSLGADYQHYPKNKLNNVSWITVTKFGPYENPLAEVRDGVGLLKKLVIPNPNLSPFLREWLHGGMKTTIGCVAMAALEGSTDWIPLPDAEFEYRDGVLTIECNEYYDQTEPPPEKLLGVSKDYGIIVSAPILTHQGSKTYDEYAGDKLAARNYLSFKVRPGPDFPEEVMDWNPETLFVGKKLVVKGVLLPRLGPDSSGDVDIIVGDLYYRVDKSSLSYCAENDPTLKQLGVNTESH